MNAAAESPMLTAALEYLRQGYRVFPCRENAKLPAVSKGVLAATDDVALVRRWWTKWPRANLALACENLLVVDLDQWPCAWPGPEKSATIKALAPPVQRTPRGGLHVFFRRPEGVAWRCSASRLAPHVDTRTAGGYVLIAPSVVNGRRYCWIRPLRPLAELPVPPEWLCRELGRLVERPQPTWRDSLPASFAEGARNDGLFRLACRLRRAGLGDHELQAALLAANAARCCPPLSEQEVRKIACSAARYAPGQVLAEMPFALRRAWHHAIQHRQRALRKAHQ